MRSSLESRRAMGLALMKWFRGDLSRIKKLPGHRCHGEHVELTWPVELGVLGDSDEKTRPTPPPPPKPAQITEEAQGVTLCVLGALGATVTAACPD